MALSPEMRAHFEAIGPSGVLLEIAERKHGQAPDSPLWREALLWVEAESLSRRDAREIETLAIARQARTGARLANKIAIAAAIFAAAATIIAAVIGVMYAKP